MYLLEWLHTTLQSNAWALIQSCCVPRCPSLWSMSGENEWKWRVVPGMWGLSMRHDNRAFWRWHCNMIWDCRFGHRSGIQESRNPGSWLWYLIAGFCRSLSFIRGGQCINIAWPCLHLLGEFHADIALAKQNKSTFREGLKQRLHWSKHITLPYIAYPCSCTKMGSDKAHVMGQVFNYE